MALSVAVKNSIVLFEAPFSQIPKVEFPVAMLSITFAPVTPKSLMPAPALLVAVTWSKVAPLAVEFTRTPACKLPVVITVARRATGPLITIPLPSVLALVLERAESLPSV